MSRTRKAAPAKAQRPSEGGSYRRQKDGSLVRVEAPAEAEPTPETEADATSAAASEQEG